MIEAIDLSVTFVRVSSFELKKVVFRVGEIRVSSCKAKNSSFELKFSSFELKSSSFELQNSSFELKFSSFELSPLVQEWIKCKICQF
jgi:hypothetical protein